MSEPKRYDPQLDNTGEFDIVMVKSSDGGFVKWDDYTRLKAEVERLRKAGDAMAVCITEFRCGRYGNALDKVGGFYVWQDWLAAKEGKQS